MNIYTFEKFVKGIHADHDKAEHTFPVFMYIDNQIETP